MTAYSNRELKYSYKSFVENISASAPALSVTTCFTPYTRLLILPSATLSIVVASRFHLWKSS